MIYSGEKMKYIIKIWLRLRLIISNFLNLLDPFNYEQNEFSRLLPSSLEQAKKIIKYEFFSKFVYKYDAGDIIRTPISVWNRTKENLLYDDCDGAAAFAYAALNNFTTYIRLLTIVPIKKPFSGHTLCLFKENNLFSIVNYDDIYEGFNSIEEIVIFIARTLYKRTFNEIDYFIIAEDVFKNNN
jgi:hypothetical protein